MYTYLMLATLSLPNIDVTVNQKNCVVKVIRYNYIHSYIHAVGNCDFIYKKCVEDNCNIEKVPDKDLNFGKKPTG